MANHVINIHRGVNKYHWHSPQYYVVEYSVNHQDYKMYTGLVRGFWIGVTEDIPNNIFESYQDGIDYHDASAVNEILTALNNEPAFAPDTFTFGEFSDFFGGHFQDKFATIDNNVSIINAIESGLAAWCSGVSTYMGGHNHTASNVTDFDSSCDGRITAQKGNANGLCPLDSGGLVSATYLPSFVDEVIEEANFGALPGTGATGKIYVTTDNNKCYRWSGSAYVEISPSPGSTDSVTEGSVNLYHTAARVRAATRNYAGTTAKDGSFTISKSATVSGGNFVIHLTDDGLSTGNALFVNGPDLDSLTLRAVDGNNPHAFGTPALSNSNKTVTVPVTKVAPVLGILALAQSANGSVIKATILGN